MKIDSRTVYTMLSKRYPNADVYVLDDEYEVPTKDMLKVAYDKFQKSLWKWNLFKWVRNKFDCEDFAWCFKASVTVGNALSKNSNAQPVGFMCYFIGGEDGQGHAINNAVFSDGEYRRIREIEPQPNKGLIELTEEERESVWLVVI